MPAISREDEIKLVRKYQRGKGQTRAAQAAATELLRVHHPFICKQARRFPVEFDDALQLARMGFLRAMLTFNPKFKFRLLTYAVYWIRVFLQRGASNDQKTSTLLSLDRPLTPDSDFALKDTLVEDAPKPDERFADAERRKIVNDLIALAKLHPIDQLIVEKRLMSDEPWTLKQVGALGGVSRERIRQRELAVLKRLRGMIDRRYDRDMLTG